MAVPRRRRLRVQPAAARPAALLPHRLGLPQLFGDSDFTARLAPALMGTIMVALPYRLRRQLGRPRRRSPPARCSRSARPTCTSPASPARTSTSRASRSRCWPSRFRFLDRPRRHHPALIGALLALSFATKESTFITGFVAATFVPVALFWQSRGGVGLRGAPLVRTLAARTPGGLGVGVVAFLAVYTILFTTFFTNPKGVYGLYTGLDYWLGQHEVGRGGEASYFYAVVLFAHEWPVLLLGAVGAVVAFRRPTLLRLFLVWAFVVSLVVYSWAGEKFAWLVLHPLMPLILLAGVGVQVDLGAPPAVVRRARPRRHRRRARLHRLRVLPGQRRARRRPARVPRLHPVRHRRRARARRGDGAGAKRPELNVTIDERGGRDVPLRLVLPPPQRRLHRPQPGERGRAADRRADPHPGQPARGSRRRLTGYDGREFRFRVWWVRDYGAMSARQAGARWFTERKPWNPTGGMPEWIYVRRVVTAG